MKRQKAEKSGQGKYRGKKKGRPGRSLGALTVCLLAVVVLLGGGILFYYHTHFVLLLRGGENVRLNLCQIYADEGVRVCRNGREVEKAVKVTGRVDTRTPGTYRLTYSLGSQSVSRTVTVADTMDPVLELKGSQEMTIRLGEAFAEPGFSAVDRDGQDLTAKVRVDKSALRKAGKDRIVYTVTDSRGKTTRITRSVTVQPNTDYDAPGLPICMFHYVYDENDPPADLYHRYGNYISVGDLSEELAWLKAENYYFPDWQEVRDYVDGKLLLPDRSIVLCFDDGARSFLELGIPVLEKYRVPATSFLITANEGEKKAAQYASDYVRYESHSDSMHQAGGYVGHGGIFTALSRESALADLRLSIKKCGSGEAFAYPYGDYTQQCRDIVEEAGFACAVTTQAGKVYPGMDPMLLPRVRMVMGQSLVQFQNKVAPQIQTAPQR